MLKHVLTAAALTIFLFKSGFFVFAVPVPVFYIFAVHGRKAGWLTAAIVITAAVLGIVFGLLARPELVYLGYLFLTGLILGEGLTRRLAIMSMASAAIFIPWIMASGFFLAGQFGFNMSLVSNLRAYFADTLNFALDKQAATLSSVQLAYVRENAGQIVDFIVRITPSALMIFGMLVVSLAVLLTRSLSKKYGSFKHLGNIAMQQFPFWSVWVTIACGAAYFSDAYFVHNIYVKFAAINGLLVCAGLYFIQGCFVVSFWLCKGRSPFLRFLVYGIIIAFLQVVGFIIVALGLSDQWLDFRKRHNTTVA